MDICTYNPTEYIKHCSVEFQSVYSTAILATNLNRFFTIAETMHLLSTLLSTSLLVSAGYCSSVSHALDARAPAVCNSADIAIVKANALQPIYFCRYYVSE